MLTEPDFMSALLMIIAINLVLSGDNALVIAIASRNLPHAHKQKAVWWGTFLAILIRAVATIAATYLFRIPYLYLIGGIILTWISFKLLFDNEKKGEIKAGENLRAAIQTIVVADIMMGLDNILAIAGAAGGDVLLIIVGLVLSIPIMLWGSHIVLKVIERFWWVIYIGAGILAWTAGDMILHEKQIAHFFSDPAMEYVLKGVLVVLILGAGLLRRYNIIRFKDDYTCT